MKRLLLLAAVTFGSSAMAEDLPVPPVPPANPSQSEIAPVPDPYAEAPVAPASEDPRVDVKLYRAKPYDPGMGFAPGSRYQTSEDRKPIQTPGFSISVPLK
ncbi:MAG: hypothetical protein P4L90_28660 [Rhodopila sp.]|nr:hypothetical protein [Rhodopila sp.]